MVYIRSVIPKFGIQVFLNTAKTHCRERAESTGTIGFVEISVTGYFKWNPKLANKASDLPDILDNHDNSP